MNAWVTAQVDSSDGNKTKKGSVDIRLMAAKDTSFKKGELSLRFTPDIVKYLLEYRIPLPSYYQGTKSIV